MIEHIITVKNFRKSFSKIMQNIRKLKGASEADTK